MKVTQLCITLLAIAAANSVYGARILGVFPFPGKSHSIMINVILQELSARGHNLDVITNFPLPPSTPNYTLIDVTPMYPFWSDVSEKLNLPGIFQMHDLTFSQTKAMLNIIGFGTTEHALKHPNVQKLLHSNDKEYDLILVEQFFQDAFLMLARKYKAPIVSIATFGANSYFDDMFGSFGAWSHAPHELLVAPDAMTFLQRAQNVLYMLMDKYNRYVVYMPQQQALADKYFAHLPGPHPTLNELSRSVSVTLQNHHTPMMSVKPTVPGLIDVGGMHIVPPKPLPANIKKYLDEAKHGVIYFSFGTQVPSSSMPEEQLSAFITVFNEFSKVKILWKWENDNVSALPKNVLPMKWMPQNDILAHPNVKLFITHGGLLGTQEGVHYGVPMLGIPFYADQHINTNHAASHGYALKLQFNNITVESLRWALTELLFNPVYAKRSKEVSRIFRDRPERAIDTAMYWIEYVIRFKGTDHLRCYGRDISWHQYFLLDILAAVGVSFLLLVVAIRFVLKKLLCGGKRPKVKPGNITADKKNE